MPQLLIPGLLMHTHHINNNQRAGHADNTRQNWTSSALLRFTLHGVVFICIDQNTIWSHPVWRERYNNTLFRGLWWLLAEISYCLFIKKIRVLWFNLNVVLKCYDQRNGVRQRLNGDLINNLVLLFSAGVCFLHLYWLSNWFGHSFVQSRKHEEHDKCYLLKINKCKSKMFNWKRKHGDVIKERWESFHVTISFITQYWCCCNVCSWAVLLWT